MNQIRTAYNQWAADYDTVINKIRDLEAHGIREMLKEIPFNNCLEVGCGTGKNSEWLATWADEVIAVDFSEEMLLRARGEKYCRQYFIYSSRYHERLVLCRAQVRSCNIQPGTGAYRKCSLSV